MCRLLFAFSACLCFHQRYDVAVEAEEFMPLAYEVTRLDNAKPLALLTAELIEFRVCDYAFAEVVDGDVAYQSLAALLLRVMYFDERAFRLWATMATVEEVTGGGTGLVDVVFGGVGHGG